MTLDLKNSIVGPLLLLITLVVGVMIGENGLKYDGSGGLFLAGCVVLLAGMGAAWYLAKKNLNVLSVIVSAICAAALALAIAFLWSRIGWERSLPIIGLFVGWVAFSLIIAVRKK